MTKNPFLNAIAASAYIGLVVLLMNFASSIETSTSSTIVSLMILSLFVLSAAVMGYIFFYQPFRMYTEGKKKDAVKLFLQTLGIFGGITVILFVLYFLKVF